LYCIRIVTELAQLLNVLEFRLMFLRNISRTLWVEFPWVERDAEFFDDFRLLKGFLAVCLLGTASIDCDAFLFLDAKFDWNPNVPSIFLLLPLLATVTKLRGLPLALVFGAMIAWEKQAMKLDGFGLCPSGCKSYT
jgi:hypothetical protein